MARNKNSTALFDVIHAAKKPPKSSPSASIPAPRWWGKDKKPIKPVVADPAENVGKQQSWLTAAKRNAGVVPAAAPTVSEHPSAVETHSSDEPVISSADAMAESKAELPVEAEPAAPKPRFIDRFKSRAAAPVVEESASPVEPEVQARELERTPEPEYTLPVFDSPVEEPPAKPEPRPARERRESMMAIDRTTGDIRFNLSYAGFAAIGFIFLMALAIAFIAGTQHASSSAEVAEPSDNKVVHSNTSPASGLAMAVGSSQVPDAPRHVSPDVLEISRSTPKLTAPVSPAPTVAPAPLPVKANRDIGMMYVVIQSYPDQEMAQKACDFVNHAGIPCTLIQGLSDFAMHDWYSVVGLQPFKKHDPNMEDYEKSITTLGLKFSTKFYNQFQPKAYTWRPDSDQASE
jgi:hypothetical protein